LLFLSGGQPRVPASTASQADIRVRGKCPSSKSGIYLAIEPAILPVLHRIGYARWEILDALPLGQKHSSTEMIYLCFPGLLHLLRLQRIDVAEKVPMGINAKKALAKGEETSQKGDRIGD